MDRIDQIQIKNLTMIKTEELFPHPDNPRKDLGDLTELTESIRKNGIMQNLTVVKGHFEQGKITNEWKPDGYTIIIGHRRCAAAKEAGLEEVPCAVADLSAYDQLCLMMEENMQRQDLTIPEQAFGFQLMFDLGMPVQEIAERTGFSESTVRGRLDIAELGKETVNKLMNNSEFQFSISDFQLLGKIKDVKKRKELAERNYYNGHYGFVNAVTDAAKRERWGENLDMWKQLLEAAGVQKAKEGVTHWTDGYETVTEFDLDKEPVTLKLKDSDTKNLYWLVNYGTLYIKKKVKKQKAKVSQKEKEEREKRKQIETMADAAWKEIEDFAKTAFDEDRKPKSKLKKDEPIRIVWNMILDMKEKVGFWDMDALEEDNYYMKSEEERKEWRQRLEKKPVWLQMLAGVTRELFKSAPVENGSRRYHEERGKEMLICKGALSQLFGFEWTDPEFEKIADGTSDLYEVWK